MTNPRGEMPVWKEEWPKIRVLLEARLEQGFKEYGDKNYGSMLSYLLGEVEEEILDQILWSSIALSKIQSLRGRVESIEKLIEAQEAGLDSSE